MSDNNKKLRLASESGDVATVRSCLAAGADVNTDVYGSTPLRTAIWHNRPQVVSVLLSCPNLDISADTSNGITSLHASCIRGYTDCLTLMVADSRMTEEMINAKDIAGKTALMLAVEYGNLSCVKEMAKLQGVDWDTKNKNGKSLEDVARMWGFWDIVEYLEQKKNTVRVNSQEVKEIAINIQALEKALKAEEKALEEIQLKDEDKFDQKQKQDKNIFKQKQKEDKDQLNEEHKKKMSKLEEELQAAIPTPLPLSHLAPECPACYERMPPPVQIFNCLNGHFVCGNCKPKVVNCPTCRETAMGRATGMEQMLRVIFKTK